MSSLAYRNRPRSFGAQIDRMSKCWPEFMVVGRNPGAVVWHGHLRAFQRTYKVSITWAPEWKDRPYVQLLDPPLEPFEAGRYENIPHLMFDGENPQASGLCLFDPEGKEWGSHMLIADTTVPWASRWLCYYDLWLYDGIWRGGGVGAESVGAAARAEAVQEQAGEHTAWTAEETSVAKGSSV